MAVVLLVVGLLVFLGHVLAEAFRKTRIPDVLVLMLIGIALGPYALQVVTPQDFGKVGPVLTTIALIVILFEGGTQMRLSAIGRSLGPTLALMLPSFVVTAGIAAAVARPFVGGWLLALTLGAILAGTSSAVVLPLLDALKLGEKPRTILALESALTDVLCIVATFGLLDAARVGRFEPTRMVTQVVSSLVVATALGVAGGVGWLALRARLKTFPNTMFTVFAYVFILYGLAEWLGFSGAIVALVFGITTTSLTRRLLARVGLEKVTIEEFTTFERGVFAEAVFLLKLFFFLYLGLTLKLDEGLPHLLGMLIVLLAYLSRTLLTTLVLDRESTRREASLAAVMAPKGLAAAVLASMVAQTRIPGSDQLQAVAFAVVLWSIVATSVLVPLVQAPALRGLRARLFRRFPEEAGPEVAAVPAGAPVAHAPADPAPADPTPADPAPADPAPADPAPADPAPADPAPAAPTPADPAPAAPTPADPTPADPAPADPTPADPASTPVAPPSGPGPS